MCGNDSHDAWLKLEDWLAERAERFPERLALVADGAELSYAELEGRRLGRPPPRGAWGRRGDRRDHAAGASSADRDPGADEARRGRAARAQPARGARRRSRSTRGLSAPSELTQTEAACRCWASYDRMLSLPGADQRQLRRPAGGRADLRQLPLERGRLGASTSASSPSDRWLCCLPLFHVAGLSILVRSAIYGTTAVIHDGFDVERVAEALEQRRRSPSSPWSRPCSRACSTPAPISPGRGRSWSAAARCRPSCSSEAIGPGRTVVQTYGLTEACSQVTTLAPADAQPQARLRRAAAADHAPADPRRRDPRPGADRRPGMRSTPTAGSTPATSADRRRGLPLRRRAARRHDRQRRRERGAGRGRGRCCCATRPSPTPPSSAAPTPNGSRR